MIGPAIAAGVLVVLAFVAGYCVGKSIGIVEEWHDEQS